MKLTMLGTGNAMVTECYNTCYTLEEHGEYLLVDAGGGNGILKQLRLAGISPCDIHTIYVTHKHVDHLLGVIWIIRTIAQLMRRGDYEGDTIIYGHREVLELLDGVCQKLIAANALRYLHDRIHLIKIADGEERLWLGHPVRFFDIHSTKDTQFGYQLEYAPNQFLTCLGDESYNETEAPYVSGSTWLLHEAFCLHSEADVFHPYEIHHSTVKDACELAQSMGIANLLLYHTEDNDLPHRKERYITEGRQYYSGNLLVPDDLETIEL